MKYYVSVAVDARAYVEVEANNFEEAKDLAVMEAGDMDWNKLECVELEPVHAEDENDHEVDY